MLCYAMLCLTTTKYQRDYAQLVFCVISRLLERLVRSSLDLQGQLAEPRSSMEEGGSTETFEAI